MVARFADDGAATSAKALITGSTSGIGLEIAQELVANGARVILNGIETAQQGDAIAGSLDDAAVYLHAELSRTATVVEQMAKPKAALGRPDSLVNNAGMQHMCQLAEFSPGKNDLIHRPEPKPGVSHHAPRAADDMQTGRGRIINIAPAHGLVGSPLQSAYVAAKHAVVGLTKVTAHEAVGENISATAICPGYVLTPLVRAQIDAQAKAHGIDRGAVIRDVLRGRQPNKKFATVAEIGALTVFFASDAAASITGTALPVNGGLTAYQKRPDAQIHQYRRTGEERRPVGGAWAGYLMFQGGGAFAAHQAGVHEALHEAGIEPDWIIATSIGAINAGIIAGNKPEDRLEKLKEF